MPNHTETRLPWGQDTITIKGRSSGVQELIVHFDGETLNIIDFLNHSLKAEYAAHYEAVMSACEAKLKSGDIFAHHFPESKLICKEIDMTKYKSVQSLQDNEFIEILLKEYHTYLEELKDNFKKYEAHVERWFNRLPPDTKLSGSN